MRCDCCPLCPIAEDDVCPESEGEVLGNIYDNPELLEVNESD